MFGMKKQSSARVVDVICGMKIDPTTAAATREHDGTTYYFCSKGCAKEFDSNPKPYAQN